MPQEKRKFGASPVRDELGQPAPTPSIFTPTPTPENPTGQKRRFEAKPAYTGSNIGELLDSVSPTLGAKAREVGEAVVPYVAPVVSKLSPVLEFLSRGQYASAKFFDSNADDSKGFLESVADSFEEFLVPKDKLSFSDVIGKRNPEFARKHPHATSIIGFVGDIALDPTTYLGVGAAKTGIKLGGKTLSDVGEEALKTAVQKTTRAIFRGSDDTLKVIGDLDSELAKPVKDSIRKIKVARSQEDEELRKVLHKRIDKETINSELPGLFEEMKIDLPLKGNPGIERVSNDPAYFSLVHRNKNGDITGIVSATVDPQSGKLLDANIGVDPKLGKGLNSPVQKLGRAFLNEGHSFDDLINSFNTYTPQGARMMKNVVDRTVYPQPKVEKVFKVGGPDKEVVDELTDKLNQVGYFQAVKQRTQILNDLQNKALGNFDADLSEKLAKNELLNDLTRNGSPLSAGEVRQRAESRILSILTAYPEAKAKMYAKDGVYLKAGLPFGKQKDLFRVAGTDHISPLIKSLNNRILEAGKFGQLIGKVEDTIGGAFNRNYNLPEEYIKFRDELENYLGYTQDAVVRDTRKLFTDLDVKGRKKIGDTMQWIDDQSRNLEQLRGGMDNVASDEYESVIKRGIQRANLSPQEQAITAQLYQNYKDMGLAEMRANLLKQNLANYSPRGYNAILDEGDMTMITRGKYNSKGGPNPYLSSSQQRKYLTNAEAKAAGLDLELDAAILYANRALSSQRALAIKQFKDSVTEMFGTYQPNSKYAHTGILPTGKISDSGIPQKIVDDMRMIGESIIPSNLSENTRDILRFIDALQRPFKKAATVWRPTFAMRQLPSNTIQSALISGVKAFKAFDPRSAVDAGLLIFRDKKSLELPQFVKGFVNKYFAGSDAVLAERAVLSNLTGEPHLQDIASQWYMRNPFGEKVTGTEMVEEMRKHGVFREMDVTGESFSKKLVDELDRDFSNKNVAKELSKFWKHAQMVEDYNRAMLYINGRRLGHSPEEATKLVNKALFDYQRGLSNFEKQAVKRAVPFYSFQRFAIPYVLKQVIKQPGNYASTQKFVGTIEKLISSGETLNPAEREAIPGYLLEQPFLFSGMDKDNKATFNILNNLTPFDALNLMVFDKNGDVDVQRSIEKSVLGAVTPFIKVPLEMLFDHNIFTEKTIEDASSLGDLSNLSGVVKQTNLAKGVKAISNTEMAQKIKKFIPQPVRDLFSWEDRTDQRTGKTKTFVNPYLAYSAMNYFPMLRDYIKPLDGTTSPFEFAMNLFYETLNPIKTGKVDLKSQSEYEQLKTKKEYSDLTKELKSAIIKGSDSKKNKSEEAIRQLYQTYGEQQKLREEFTIRGKGLGRGTEEEADTIPANPSPNIPQIIK